MYTEPSVTALILRIDEASKSEDIREDFFKKIKAEMKNSKIAKNKILVN